MRNQARGAILSEWMLAEDCLEKSRSQTEPTRSDSQDTEALVPSDEKVDNDNSTTASSFSPVSQKTQKRVYPSWFSDECCNLKETTTEKRILRKVCGKNDAFSEEEQKASTVNDANLTSQTVQGKGKSRLFDGGASKRSLLQKQKHDPPRGIQDSVSKAEENIPEFEQILTSRAPRRNTQKLVPSSAKHGLLPARKRQRGRKYVESDLSEEEEPARCSFEGKEDLVLTTEDLIDLATKHLETERINEPGNNQSHDAAFHDELQRNSVAAPKSKGSIFSVRGWSDIANTGLDAKAASFSQDVPQLAPTFGGDASMHRSEGSIELDTDAPSFCGDLAKDYDNLGTAENVVDDMLGLIFGPTLSKTVSSRLECSQSMVQDVSQSTKACPDDDIKDIVLPVLENTALQQKKKSSLKDKVMMYLG